MHATSRRRGTERRAPRAVRFDSEDGEERGSVEQLDFTRTFGHEFPRPGVAQEGREREKSSTSLRGG